MWNSRSLRFRITLTLFLFVSLGSSLFALTIYYAFDVTEEQFYDEVLEQEFREYAQMKSTDPDQPLPFSSVLHSYLIGQGSTQGLPPELWSLGPGYHHDVAINGRTNHVLVRELGEERIYLAQDIARVEQRESRLAIFLTIGVLAVSGAVVWVGYLLSRRVIAPVTKLADRVSHMAPHQSRISLAAEFAGSEMQIIGEAFDRFLERLDQFIAREHAFTEDASHELRTPLAVINTASELLLADTRHADDLRQPLLRIQRASRQMTRLTRALLFLAREPESHAEDAGHCQADSVAAEVLDSYRQLHAGQPVEIRLNTEPMTLPVPPELFEIVLANLLQNALAYTQQGHVCVALLQGGLTVEDTGGGIRPEDLPRIFERHYRGAGSRGIGRGLDLVKRICDRQGWRIEVTSQPGQGTRFSVHLGESTRSS